MKKKVLFFFPQNPIPPRSGAHRRCLQMLSGLAELGCDITFSSSNLFSETEWQSSSAEALRAMGVKDVRIQDASPLNYRVTAYLLKLYRNFKKKPEIKNARLATALFSPPPMRRWFKKIFFEIKPEIIIMNYAYWDGLVDHKSFKESLRIMDAYDLVTLNAQMRYALETRFPKPPIQADAVDPDILKEDFFSKLNLAVHASELEVYDQYHDTICVTSQEAEIVRKNTRRTKVHAIPITHEPVYLSNQYTGPALFAAGRNPFNIQGYLYFVKRVLPSILKAEKTFSLQVIGPCCESVGACEGIVLKGFVPDLKSVYETARFAICPVFGGTGQQVKILEAMAHGLAVIALRSAAEGSPIRDGENGFIAGNAEEFAECVIRLWHDSKLCMRLGEAARTTISQNISRSKWLERLASVIRPV